MRRIGILAVVAATAIAATGIVAEAKTKGSEILATVDGNELDAGTFGAALRYSQASYRSNYENTYAQFGMAFPDSFWNEPMTTESESESLSEEAVSAETESETVAETESESEVRDGQVDLPKFVAEQAGEPKTFGESYEQGILSGLIEAMLCENHAKEYGVELDEETKKKAREAAKRHLELNDSKIFSEDGTDEENVERMLELYAVRTATTKAVEDSTEVEVSDDEANVTSITYATFKASDFEPATIEETEADARAVLEDVGTPVTNPADRFSDETEAETESETEAPDYDAKAREAAETSLSEIMQGGELEAVTTVHDSNAYAVPLEFQRSALPDSVPAEVLDATRTLADGEVYGSVIEADGAYWIVRLDAELDEEATEAKRKEVESDKRGDFYRSKVSEWLSEADASVDGEVLGKMKVTDETDFVLKSDPSNAETAQAQTFVVGEDGTLQAAEDETGAETEVRIETEEIATEAVEEVETSAEVGTVSDR